MARKKKDEIIPIPVTDETPVKKSRKPRVSNKLTYDQLTQKLAATEHLLEQTQEQLKQTNEAINRMAGEYTRITNYVMKSLNVFYESTLMAFKEEK